MKIKTIITAICLTASAFSQTPPDIKGFVLGMTMEECLIQKLGEHEYRKELERRKTQRSSSADFYKEFGTDFLWGLRHPTNPNVYVLYLGTMVGSNRPQLTIGGAKANINGLFKVETSNATSILYVVSATFSNSVSDIVLQGLIEKYGEPTSKNAVEKFNRMGAKFSGVDVIWKIGDKYTILFQSIGSKVDEANLSIFDDVVMDKVDKMKNPLSKDI
jgi:hypothetical protein